jgi:hypothetical protein
MTSPAIYDRRYGYFIEGKLYPPSGTAEAIREQSRQRFGPIAGSDRAATSITGRGGDPNLLVVQSVTIERLGNYPPAEPGAYSYGAARSGWLGSSTLCLRHAFRKCFKTHHTARLPCIPDGTALRTSSRRPTLPARFVVKFSWCARRFRNLTCSP